MRRAKKRRKEGSIRHGGECDPATSSLIHASANALGPRLDLDKDQVHLASVQRPVQQARALARKLREVGIIQRLLLITRAARPPKTAVVLRGGKCGGGEGEWKKRRAAALAAVREHGRRNGIVHSHSQAPEKTSHRPHESCFRIEYAVMHMSQCIVSSHRAQGCSFTSEPV